MTPAQCRVKHDPENGKFGDCVRACIASVLDVSNPETVPHFAHDNPDADVMFERIRGYLLQFGYAPHVVPYPPTGLDEFLQGMATNNPTGYYILLGNTGEGDHAVVGEGGAIVHNPAWVGGDIIEPHSQGLWVTILIVRA